MRLEGPVRRAPGRPQPPWAHRVPMDDRRPTSPLSPQTKRAQGGVGAPHLHGGGPAGNRRGPREENDPGTTRAGRLRSSGSNEPKHGEHKEGPGWQSRQGGEPRSREDER